jgi:hypothetical protein
VAATIAGCGGAEATPAHARTGVIDSVVSRDTTIARFQRDLPPVTKFEGGAGSRDQLVGRFITALEKGDSATLRSLLLTRAEFGRLYYPTNPEAMPPYNMSPELMWFMVQGHNDRGFRKLLQQRSGKPLRLLGHRCEGAPSYQGDNTVWGPCLVLRRSESGDTLAERLFGQIVERDGRYKFLSFANKL